MSKSTDCSSWHFKNRSSGESSFFVYSFALLFTFYASLRSKGAWAVNLRPHRCGDAEWDAEWDAVWDAECDAERDAEMLAPKVWEAAQCKQIIRTMRGRKGLLWIIGFCVRRMPMINVFDSVCFSHRWQDCKCLGTHCSVSHCDPDGKVSDGVNAMTLVLNKNDSFIH